MDTVPLAEKMRPQSIDEVIGQTHLVGKDMPLRQIIESGKPTSLILWGPPGTGKTTLARIIARSFEADCIELSAVTSGKKDIEIAVERARRNQNLGEKTVLFVDEIHRFNKAQQDGFLPHIESGLITLIGATTENPSFELNRPLLSRSRVLILEPLADDDIEILLARAASTLNATNRIDDDGIKLLAHMAGGDGRVALGMIELVLETNTNEQITIDQIKTAVQKRLPGYDKTGEMHYDVTSAFIKSMRGSDPDAALYYMARMLEAGEDPLFIARRMVVFASEDIGLAGNGALSLATSCFESVRIIGLPECRYALFHTALALSKSAKSRSVADSMSAATKTAKEHSDAIVPLQLRNAPTELMKEAGYNKGYQWSPDFTPDQAMSNGFLPTSVNRYL